MRTLLVWFNARRRLVGLALLGLMTLGYLSAGRTPQADEWIQIPELGLVLALVLGILSIVGLVLLAFARLNAGTRNPGELRTIRTLLVLVVLVGAAAIWFGPSEVVEETPIAEEEETAVSTGNDLGITTSVDMPTANGTDIAALGLILVIIAAVLVRRLRGSQPAVFGSGSGVELTGSLAPAVEAAHHYLSDEADPRSAVLKAYSSLESALFDLGHARDPAETPGEHMARVLVDIPVLARPAVRLGMLYEVARFSENVITEEDRQDATLALGRARSLLTVPEPSHS